MVHSFLTVTHTKRFINIIRMPARRPSLPRLAVVATALSSSLRCSRGSSTGGGGAASGYAHVSSVQVFFAGGGRRQLGRAPPPPPPIRTSYISTWSTKHNTCRRPSSFYTTHQSRSSRDIMSSRMMMSLSSPPTTWSDLLLTSCDDHQHQVPWTMYAHNLFPPLTSTSHKGSSGRIAILGGSDRYTGAPYYAAQSALHCGVDLVSIYCATEACIPIKCYSPELMVQGVYSIEQLNVLLKEGEEIVNELEKCKMQNNNTTTSNNELTEQELQQTMKKIMYSDKDLIIQNELRQKNDRIEILSERLAKIQSLEDKLSHWRVKEHKHITDIVHTITSNFVTLHTLCIGPGLGRHPLVFSIVKQVLYKAMECQLMLILDADVLYMLSLIEYRSLLEDVTKYERCVMTPNLMEMKRLNDAFLSLSSIESNNNILVQKGHNDKISYKTDNTVMVCKEEGGLKRSGGIGDVLAGAISAFMAWNVISEKGKSDVADSAFDNGDGANDDRQIGNDERQNLPQQRVLAAWTAATLVKRATKLAYEKKRRSMSAINVVEEIGNVMNDMEEDLRKLLQKNIE